MPIRVLVVGAGAIGAFIGSRLATLPKHEVAVSALCRSNYQAVLKDGFRISSPQFGSHSFKPEYTFSNSGEAKRTTSEKGLRWNYLLVSTKVLPEINDDSQLLEGLVSDETSIVLVQNGLGIEEPYRKRFPSATILSGVTIISAVQSSPGEITHNRWTKTSIGPYLPSQSLAETEEKQRLGTATHRSEAFVDMLKRSGISDTQAFSHAHLQLVRWHKIAINAAINASCVLSGGSGNRALSLDPEMHTHLLGVMEEVLTTAPVVLGLDSKEFPFQEMGLPTPEQILRSIEKNMTGSRPSMWWDWVEGRRMEVEAILGNPVRIAREKGVEMSRVQSLYALLRMGQENRDRSRADGSNKL